MYYWLEKIQLIVSCEQLYKLLYSKYQQRDVINIVMDGMSLDASNDLIKHVKIIASMFICL
jgi:hypothetical protein